MKQFSLEEYLENPNMQVVTMDGRPARIICTDAKTAFPIIALILEKDGSEAVCSYNARGEYWRSNELSDTDLIFARTKKEGWVNIYNQAVRGCGFIYESEEKAKQNADKDKPYIATVKIEWEE